MSVVRCVRLSFGVCCLLIDVGCVFVRLSVCLFVVCCLLCGGIVLVGVCLSRVVCGSLCMVCRLWALCVVGCS